MAGEGLLWSDEFGSAGCCVVSEVGVEVVR